MPTAAPMGTIYWMGTWYFCKRTNDMPAEAMAKKSMPLSGKKILWPNHTARFRTTPTTAAVTPFSAAWIFWFPARVSMNGAPAKIKKKQGRVRKQLFKCGCRSGKAQSDTNSQYSDDTN